MSEFETALKAKLARNAELAEERRQAEQEMERAQAEAQARAARQEEAQREARLARHAELVDHLTELARGLKEASPEDFIVRMGWAESGEEFIAKISTRLLEPARSLLVELDREDDEVLVRWHSDIGRSLELWRLLEADTTLLTELVLQVADQELWKEAHGPPPFPDS